MILLRKGYPDVDVEEGNKELNVYVGDSDSFSFNDSEVITYYE